MNEREEHENTKQYADESEDIKLDEQIDSPDMLDLSGDEQKETNVTQSTKPITEETSNQANPNATADESTDEQTDIYYQDEAVVAIEQEEVQESSNIENTQAGFWIRFWAYLLDVVIVFSVNGIVLAPVGFFREAAMFEWQIISVAGVLSGIVYYLYFLLMTKIFQQTLGKMVMGIKVVSTSNNERLVWGDLFFREVIGRFIHNVFFILKLLYIVVAFTAEKKGVHDIIGNTRVIHVA